MSRKLLIFSAGYVKALASLACAWAGLAAAAPLTVVGTYQLLDNVSVNSAGLGAGLRQQLGSTCVVLVGNPCTPQNAANAVGTSGTATQGSQTLPLNFSAADQTSNHWFYAGSASLPDGQWSLKLTNGQNTTTALTPSLAGAQVIGFAGGTALTTVGATPTFSWTLPTLSGGASIESVSINVRDLTDFRGSVGVGGLGVAAIIYSNRALPGSTTSLTIAPGDSHFLAGNNWAVGRHYALEIQLQDTRTNLPATSFAQVLSQSRTFLDFTLSNTGLSEPLYLPMANYAGQVPVYQFTGVPVQAGKQIFIDPVVAVGFDYQTQAGDPNFASVTLPVDVGDGQYRLWLWDDSQWVDSGQSVTGGEAFNFGALGVSRFRVTGIEPGAALNPVALNFITGLTFVADGQFNGSMTPLVVEVHEPAATFLLIAGLSALLLWRRASQRRPFDPKWMAT